MTLAVSERTLDSSFTPLFADQVINDIFPSSQTPKNGGNMLCRLFIFYLFIYLFVTPTGPNWRLRVRIMQARHKHTETKLAY